MQNSSKALKSNFQQTDIERKGKTLKEEQKPGEWQVEPAVP
jgi:hypothetical protein